MSSLKIAAWGLFGVSAIGVGLFLAHKIYDDNLTNMWVPYHIFCKGQPTHLKVESGIFRTKIEYDCVSQVGVIRHEI